jgi:hypothetical protein
MKHISYSLFFITFVFISSCYYDNEEALYPFYNTSCDTANVTFSGTIKSVLLNNCLSCHSNAAAPSSGNNIRLEVYSDVRAQINAVQGSINHTGNYSPMPKNGGKLKACSLKQFDIWIRQGILNN